ncbi:hypothetical protein GCM10007884_36280 [Methylobacterium brachythecii]|uniref:Uncharacterized protein n=1 Tax=Methylobacterium brachythecii TaxID=1176177 RepID=A0ABQ6D677_9HYPH|nr:hypothetical protein GCM10007884_36280 [Methylobacterium brachythecii]
MPAAVEAAVSCEAPSGEAGSDATVHATADDGSLKAAICTDAADRTPLGTDRPSAAGPGWPEATTEIAAAEAATAHTAAEATATTEAAAKTAAAAMEAAATEAASVSGRGDEKERTGQCCRCREDAIHRLHQVAGNVPW